jgi:hypothetical protein
MNASVPEAVIYSGHPSWRSMLDFHLAGLIAAAAGGAIARLATKNWGLAIAVFAGILALSVLIGFIRRVATHYTITDRRLHIRRGILSRTEQHTTIGSRTSKPASRCSSGSCGSAPSTSTPPGPTTRSSPSRASPRRSRSWRPLTGRSS